MGVQSTGALVLLHAVLLCDRLRGSTRMTLSQMRASGVSTEPGAVQCACKCASLNPCAVHKEVEFRSEGLEQGQQEQTPRSARKWQRVMEHMRGRLIGSMRPGVN